MSPQEQKQPQDFRLTDYPIIAFIATNDPARARRFYSDTLGLPLISDELPFALVYDANGTMLRVTAVHEFRQAAYTVLGWQVPDVAAAVASLASTGVRFERYESMSQDDLGIWTAPGGTRVAWFKDPDGNTLSVSGH